MIGASVLDGVVEHGAGPCLVVIGPGLGVALDATGADGNRSLSLLGLDDRQADLTLFTLRRGVDDHRRAGG